MMRIFVNILKENHVMLEYLTDLGAKSFLFSVIPLRKLKR